MILIHWPWFFIMACFEISKSWKIQLQHRKVKRKVKGKLRENPKREWKIRIRHIIKAWCVLSVGYVSILNRSPVPPVYGHPYRPGRTHCPINCGRTFRFNCATFSAILCRATPALLYFSSLSVQLYSEVDYVAIMCITRTNWLVVWMICGFSRNW